MTALVLVAFLVAPLLGACAAAAALRTKRYRIWR